MLFRQSVGYRQACFRAVYLYTTIDRGECKHLFHRHAVCHSLGARVKADKNCERWFVFLQVEKVCGVGHGVAVMRAFLSRVRARIIYMVFGGNECLACSALHPSYFLPYFSLIGFKVGGVNAEKGVSCGGHKVGWITCVMGEWGTCSA